MNKIIASVTVGCLTIGSLAIGLSPKVEAFASRTTLPIENSTTSPKSVEQAEQQTEVEQQIASTYCEVNYVNGMPVSCCMDEYGNWACVW